MQQTLGTFVDETPQVLENTYDRLEKLTSVAITRDTESLIAKEFSRGLELAPNDSGFSKIKRRIYDSFLEQSQEARLKSEWERAEHLAVTGAQYASDAQEKTRANSLVATINSEKQLNDELAAEQLTEQRLSSAVNEAKKLLGSSIEQNELEIIKRTLDTIRALEPDNPNI